jgi:ankyrin repeat protein
MEFALKKMNVEMVQILLNAGANPNYRDSLGGGHTEDKALSRYPLHNAARPATKEALPFDWDSRKQKITETLLQGGANPYASYSDNSYVLQVIVEENGFLNPFFKMGNLDVEKRGRHGRTLLLSASVVLEKPHREVWDKHIKKEFPPTANPKAVLALLARGAIADVMDDQERTPLHCLCAMTHPYDEDHQQAFDALVSSAPSTIHVADNAGFKPLHRASQSCQSWAIWRLADLGADLLEPDPDGNTALHFLAPKMVGEKTSAAAAQAEFKLLLAQGLNINARNNKGETPLFLGISAEWSGTRPINTSHPTYALENDVSPSDVLDLYIGRGADIFTADCEGKTLLHAAAGRRIEDPDSNTDQIKHMENVFKKLMDMGLDPRVEDLQMRTAIDMAVARGRKGIVDFFAEK